MKSSDLITLAIALCSLGTAAFQYAGKIEAEGDVIEVAGTLAEVVEATARMVPDCGGCPH